MVQRSRTPTEAFNQARDAERAARAAWLLERRKALGGDKPRNQLAWLLDFAYRPDLEQLRPEARGALRFDLLMIVQNATDGRWTFPEAEQEPISPGQVRAPLPRSLSSILSESGVHVQRTRSRVPLAELQAAQQAIRRALEALVDGRLYHERLSAPLRRVARLGPAEIPAPASPRRRFVVVNTILASLPDALVAAALELLAETPPLAVRRCEPASSFGIRCGRVFVGDRRQKYCTAHRDAIRQAQSEAALKRFRKKAKRRKKGGRR